MTALGTASTCSPPRLMLPHLRLLKRRPGMPPFKRMAKQCMNLPCAM